MLEKPMWQGPESGLWTAALQELSPANNHEQELESRSFPSQAFRYDPTSGLNDCNLLRDSVLGDSAEPCSDS